MPEIEELAQELVEIISSTEIHERRRKYGITYMLDAYKALEAALKQSEEKKTNIESTEDTK